MISFGSNISFDFQASEFKETSATLPLRRPGTSRRRRTSRSFTDSDSDSEPGWRNRDQFDSEQDIFEWFQWLRKELRPELRKELRPELRTAASSSASSTPRTVVKVKSSARRKEHRKSKRSSSDSNHRKAVACNCDDCNRVPASASPITLQITESSTENERNSVSPSGAAGGSDIKGE